MDLALTETQLMLRDSARRYLADVCPRLTMMEIMDGEVGHSPEMWQAMADMGWMGLLVPEKYGGTPSNSLDVGVLLHEMGRANLPSPFFDAAVLSPLILLAGASEAQKEALLPAIVNGEKTVVLSLTEEDYGWTADKVNMPAVRRGGRFRLDGTKFFTPWATIADQLLVVARTSESEDPEDGLTLFLVDSNSRGLSHRVMTGHLLAWKWCEVTFDGVEVDRANVVGEIGGAWDVLTAAFERAIPLLCSLKVGGCEQVFEMSVQYSRDRVQFGQPIGRFQRVQDMIICIVDAMDGARWMTYETLWKQDANQLKLAEAVAADKAFTSKAFVDATNWTHRMYGGMGLLHESGVPRFTAMARSLYHYLGGPRHHKRVLAELLKF